VVIDKEIDEFDRRILRLLQADSRLTAESVSQQVGLSGSAVQRRVNRLREMGVIKAEVAVLDRSRLGQKTTAIVEVCMESEKPALLAQFQQWLQRETKVQQAWYVSGVADYVLVVVTSDLEEFGRFLEKLLEQNQMIKECKTSFCLNLIKSSLAVPF
jgi:Lrp/AsnC family leucine-responsive transcriptional regulator